MTGAPHPWRQGWQSLAISSDDSASRLVSAEPADLAGIGWGFDEDHEPVKRTPSTRGHRILEMCAGGHSANPQPGRYRPPFTESRLLVVCDCGRRSAEFSPASVRRDDFSFKCSRSCAFADPEAVGA